MSTNWFSKYTTFKKKNQKENATKVLIRAIRLEIKNPLVYLLLFKELYPKKKISFLTQSFYQSLFFFPSSLFIKEILVFLLVRFFPRGEKTAFIIFEYIIPLLKTPKREHALLLSLCSQYFYKRKILDSALLYAQMAFYYNQRKTREIPFLLNHLSILQFLRHNAEIKKVLKQEFALWNREIYNADFLSYLFPLLFFLPKKDLLFNIKHSFLFLFGAKSSKKKPAQKKQLYIKKTLLFLILLCLILLCLLSFFLHLIKG